jgi:hypothetical protein
LHDNEVAPNGYNLLAHVHCDGDGLDGGRDGDSKRLALNHFLKGHEDVIALTAVESDLKHTSREENNQSKRLSEWTD